MQEGTEEEAAYFEDECDGLGFATVEEDQGTRVGDHGDSDVGDDARGGWRRNRERDGSPPVGMRGGRFRYWMNARRERERNRDALRSHPLWTIREADRGLGEDDENEFFDGQDEEQERGRGEGERRSVPLSKFLRPTRRHQLTNMVRDSVENGRG
jgi:hypothetical protein